ncbi:ABC transporter substrate-binding protein [Burkholderia ubonensis]|uniref:ABC transporter substrate-binding protein n=1 Tax=Burkholderia ubonensis TaxID=101571 RepID=A0A108CEU3_9BURK|nr:ABC transporter substrate-binding protein [Burkholderia ubonensis]KWK73278.1 ABC transporter substrate-binding protein [Burkholderia ubonensis]
MNRLMRSRGRRAAAALFVLGLVPASHAAQPTLRVGIDAESYPPFFSKDAAGKWKGWEIDVLDAACGKLNVRCELTDIAWDGLIPALQNRRIDVIWSSMTITGERQKAVDFSRAYYESPTVFVGAKSDRRRVDCAVPASFKGRVIGVEAGTNFSAFLDSRFKQDAQIKAFDKFDNALADLVSGRVDYVQEGKGLFTAFLASRDGKDFEVKATCADNPVLGLGIGAGVRHGDALRGKLSTAIAQLQQDGTWDAITARYPNLKGTIEKGR